jgi:glycosyltransferase involved in cell wall biosynthesis
MIHVITPEYPPRHGGVAQYTQQLAGELARTGEAVHVWCPGAGAEAHHDSVTVHAELGRFGWSTLTRAGRLLDRYPAPRRLLVQWVPHGYGRRAMNLPFCVWLWNRAAAGDDVELMVHEPFVEFSRSSFTPNVIAAVQRVMTAILLNAVRRVWVAIPAWEPLLRPFALGRRVPFGWLPIPSSLSEADREIVAAVRSGVLGRSKQVVGHFGTYGSLVTPLLTDAIDAVARRCPDVRFHLIGVGSAEFRARLIAGFPRLDGRVSATGAMELQDVAAHIAACDVLLQPYPDGISSRRTTAMAGLSLGVPVVTTSGHLTEPLWQASGAVHLSAVGDASRLADDTAALLDDDGTRVRVALAARALYDREFDIRHAVRALTGERPALVAGAALSAGEIR